MVSSHNFYDSKKYLYVHKRIKKYCLSIKKYWITKNVMLILVKKGDVMDIEDISYFKNT